MTDYEGALNEILSLINDCVKNEVSSLLEYTPFVMWPGIEYKQEFDFTKFNIIVEIVSTNSKQSSFRNNELKRTFTDEGFVFVIIKCPKSIENSIVNGRKIAMVFRNKFRTYVNGNGVWLRNSKLFEMASSVQFKEIGVTADFTFDEQL